MKACISFFIFFVGFAQMVTDCRCFEGKGFGGNVFTLQLMKDSTYTISYFMNFHGEVNKFDSIMGKYIESDSNLVLYDSNQRTLEPIRKCENGLIMEFYVVEPANIIKLESIDCSKMRR